MAVYDRALIELLRDYETEQEALRTGMVTRVYHNCKRMMAAYGAFLAKFEAGGEYESLAEQYASDLAEQGLDEQIGTMLGAMTTVVMTLEAIGPELFPGVEVAA